MVKAYLDRDQGESLRNLARENDRSLSAELRRAVRSHLERSLAEPAGKVRPQVEPRTPEGGSDDSAHAKRPSAPGSASDKPKLDLPPPAKKSVSQLAATPGVSLASEVPGPVASVFERLGKPKP